MARMHTRKHGTSGPKIPAVKEKPSVDKTKVLKTILEYAKLGMSESEIGRMVKKRYKAHVKRIFGKGVAKILRENNLLTYPEDLFSLMKKAIRLRKHLEVHKGDKHNKLALQRVESKIHRLVKYYKKKEILPKDWKYEPSKVALIVK
ncbi:MAG: 30S ribosomal protein S15 [Candidatus Micrarchaeia archaeon]|jgi:small subunit ribosomal protein S15